MVFRIMDKDITDYSGIIRIRGCLIFVDIVNTESLIDLFHQTIIKCSFYSLDTITYNTLYTTAPSSKSHPREPLKITRESAKICPNKVISPKYMYALIKHYTSLKRENELAC